MLIAKGCAEAVDTAIAEDLRNFNDREANQ